MPLSQATAGDWNWMLPGSQGNVDSFQQAIEAIHATSIGALLTKQELDTISQTAVSYKLSAPPLPPNITDWQYSYGNGNYYSSEDAAASAFEAYQDSFESGQCPGSEMTPSGPWAPVSNEVWGSQHEIRSYTLTIHRYYPTPTPHCEDLIAGAQLERVRSASCPNQYQFTATPPYCVNTNVAFVTGPTNECNRCEPVPPYTPLHLFDPIDINTGDLSQAETDYSGPGLKFTRYYHSGTIETAYSIRAGWKHGYVAKLFLSSGTPLALLRPDGYQEAFWNSGGRPTARSGSGLRVAQDGTQWVITEPSGARQIYDSGGTLVQLIDSTGAVTTINYANNAVSSVVGPFGHTLQFAYTDGVLTQLTLPGGGTIQYAHDGNGNLSQVTYPDGKTRTYHYEASGMPHHLTGITDENNVRFATFAFDTLGRAISAEHAGGAEAGSLIYGSTTTTATDAAGMVSTYTFDPNTYPSRRVQKLSRNGLERTFVVPTVGTDVERRVTQVTDPRGNVTKFNYDSWHLTSIVEAYGTALARTTSYQYDSNPRSLPTLITEQTRTTANTYNTAGNLLTNTVTDTTVTPNVSRTWTYTYDVYGRMLTADGPRTDVSDVTTYTYYTCSTGSQCGQVHTITNALSQVTTFNTYDAHGKPLTITDPNGVVTTLAYDARQRLTSRQVGSETTTFQYWPTRLLKKATLPDGAYLLYTYDDAHRLTTIQDGEGNRITYTLDAMGNRTAESAYDPSNALARTRSQVFNTLNQLWKQVGAAGTAAVTTTFSYDNNGNETGISAPLSRTTTQTYDELNRLKDITDPASGVTSFGYDGDDRLTSVTDPRSKLTTYTYNGLGDLTQQVSPDAGTTTRTYDTGGNIATQTDARAKTGTYSYDALNRATSIAYPDLTTSFTYDSGANGVGRLTGASDANHTLSFNYDGLGRVTGKTQTVGSIAKSVSYAYTNGDLTSVTTPSGQTLTYTYTEGRISSITLNGSTTILDQALYEPFGPLSGWRWGNGTYAVRVFDADGKPTTVDSGGASDYGYDDAFRITSITDASNSSNSWTYGYDALDRLTAAAKTGTTIGYTYDANGNRLSQTGTQTATYTISSTSNRVSSISGAPTRSYTYDAAGNTTADGTNAYTYTDAGRLSSVTRSGLTTTYVYNALGQRVKKSNSGLTRYFFYDESGHLLGEYDGSGTLIQETVWLNDVPVATLRPNGSGVSLYYVHTDHLNTPRRISRPSDNAIVWRWDSDPFGTDAPNEDPDGDSVTLAYNLRFPGQYADSESGIAYNYFRDYDPATGRYVESDPIGLEGGINTYAYVQANPLTDFDAFGLAGSKSGGPWHPPVGVKTKCRPSDSCPSMTGKIFILTKMAYSHIGWDAVVPFPRGGTRHATEIEDILKQLTECEALLARKCTPKSCPPAAPPRVLPLPRASGFSILMIWQIMLDMCASGVRGACGPMEPEGPIA